MTVSSPGQGDATDESRTAGFTNAEDRLAWEYGLENAAFATLALNSTLYQMAAREGHLPRVDDARSEMGQVRQYFQVLPVFFSAQELAQESDFEGFKSALENPHLKQVLVVQGEEHLRVLFEEARTMDLSGTALGLEIHWNLVESVGEDRYWDVVFVDYVQRIIAIQLLRNSLFQSLGDDTSQDEAFPAAWLDLQEEAWDNTAIQLTDASPEAIRLEAVRSYMNAYLAAERDSLQTPSR